MILLKTIYTTFLLFFIVFESKAVRTFKSEIPNDSLRKTYSYNLNYVDMRSTHQNHFRGANFMVWQKLKKNFSLGLGIEYAHSSFHGDNGYNLYNLTFIPVFLDVRYNFKTESRKFQPYLTIEPGLSFAKYKRENQNTGNVRIKISERGLYLYLGTGAKYQINKHLAPIVDFGFKGYKMSFNNLDINPHGIVLRAGLVIQ